MFAISQLIMYWNLHTVLIVSLFLCSSIGSSRGFMPLKGAVSAQKNLQGTKTIQLQEEWKQSLVCPDEGPRFVKAPETTSFKRHRSDNKLNGSPFLDQFFMSFSGVIRFVASVSSTF